MLQLPGRIRLHASWIMAEMQGKVANGELPASTGEGGLFSYHLSQKSGTSSQWRTVPVTWVRPPAAGTDASPGLPMGNGTMEDGEVP